jgi:hypothetical protein
LQCKVSVFTHDVERVCVEFHLDQCTPLVIPSPLDRKVLSPVQRI